MPQSNPSRITHFINRKPASNIHHGIRFAEELGLPLNTFVTFNLTHTNCAPDAASYAFARLRNDYFGKWMVRTSGRRGSICAPTFVWSIENCNGHLNVHWLVHIPKGMHTDFRTRLPGWLATVTGGLTCPKAVHVRSAPTPRAAGRYMLKGIDPAYAEFYGVRHQPQGIVFGNRCRFSENVGPAARNRAGYKPKRRFMPYPAGGTAAKATATVHATR